MLLAAAGVAPYDLYEILVNEASPGVTFKERTTSCVGGIFAVTGVPVQTSCVTPTSCGTSIEVLPGDTMAV